MQVTKKQREVLESISNSEGISEESLQKQHGIHVMRTVSALQGRKLIAKQKGAWRATKAGKAKLNGKVKAKA